MSIAVPIPRDTVRMLFKYAEDLNSDAFLETCRQLAKERNCGIGKIIGAATDDKRQNIVHHRIRFLTPGDIGFLRTVLDQIRGANRQIALTAIMTAKNRDGECPATLLGEHNQHEMIDLFVRYGVTLNTGDVQGMTALHRAVNCGHFETAAKLLEAGVDINIPDKAKSTPLHHAAVQDDLNAVRWLCDHGAYTAINLADSDGYTPMGLACAIESPLLADLMQQYL